jgi:hypothetical protein
LLAAHPLLVVGVDQQGQQGPVDAGRGFDHGLDVAVANQVVEPGEVASRRSLTRR